MTWERLRASYDAVATRYDAAFADELDAKPADRERLAAFAAAGLAFYAVIHLRRSEQAAAWSEVARVLRPGGRVVVTAHEGEGTIEADDFLGAGVPFVATLLTLDELAREAEAAGLDVVAAHRRDPYPQEHPTVRLTVEAVRPA